MIKYNDNELLYLHSWHSEEALNILIEKYSSFIRYKLHCFRIKSAQIEDFFQESLMTLYQAINSFNPDKNTSFYTYFEILLERRIMRLLSLNKKDMYNTIVVDPFAFDFPDPIDYEQNYYQYELLQKVKGMKMNQLKQSIFNEIFIENKKINDFAKEHHIDNKDVYNQVYLLRKKLRDEIVK